MFAIETERLLIRPWLESDRPALLAIMSNPEVTQYVHGGKAYTDDDVTATFARHARGLAETGVCMGAAVEKSRGNVIGISGVQRLGTTSDYEIGWIFGRESWGRGYATEAGAAAMRYVLETMQQPRVVAIIDPENEPSKRVAARLGMELEGRYTGEQLGHRMPTIVVDLFVRQRT